MKRSLIVFKKPLIVAVLAFILLASSAKSVSVIETGTGYMVTDAVSLKTIFMNQDPYPADPGSYANLLFKVENWGTKKAENVICELLPEYPFSLDLGANATKELGTIGSLEAGERAYFLKYKVRVDKDAIDGEAEIKVRCYGTSAVLSTGTFNVTVLNPRTDFDVVVQDSTATSTSLAIANIGANTAYSVVVRIPEQENFRVTGTSANIMGNLDAGDYTLVSFSITQRNVTGAITGTSAEGVVGGQGRIPIRNITNTTNIASIPTGGKENLVVEISYTDGLGIRRTVQKEVRLYTSGTSQLGTGLRSVQGSSTDIWGQFQTITGSGLMYIGIGIAGIIVIALFFRFIKRKKK